MLVRHHCVIGLSAHEGYVRKGELVDWVVVWKDDM